MKNITKGFNMQIAQVIFKILVSDSHWESYLKQKYQQFLIPGDKPLFKITLHRSQKPTNFRDGILSSIDTIHIPKSCRYFKLFNTNLKIIFSTHLLNYNGIVFHASCFQKNGFGYIFIGPSGSGKSTILKLLPHYQPLGDDSAIVRKIGKHYFLHGSPFYEKNPIPKVNMHIPIKGLYFLNQSSEDKLVRTDQAHLKLFRHTWLYISKTLNKIERVSIQKKLWLLSFDLATHIPVYDLFFTKSTRFLKMLEI